MNCCCIRLKMLFAIPNDWCIARQRAATMITRKIAASTTRAQRSRGLKPRLWILETEGIVFPRCPLHQGNLGTKRVETMHLRVKTFKDWSYLSSETTKKGIAILTPTKPTPPSLHIASFQKHSCWLPTSQFSPRMPSHYIKSKDCFYLPRNLSTLVE